MLNLLLLLLWFIKIIPIWLFPKIGGFPPKSSIWIGFSIINHPFWGTPIFGNTHIPWYHADLLCVDRSSIVRFLRLSSQSIVIWCELDLSISCFNRKDFHLATNHPTIGVNMCICYWGGKGCSHPQWRMGWNWWWSMRGHHRQPGFVRVLLIDPRNLSNSKWHFYVSYGEELRTYMVSLYVL